MTKTGLCAEGRGLTSGSHAGGSTQWRRRPAEVHTVSPALTAVTLTLTNKINPDLSSYF